MKSKLFLLTVLLVGLVACGGKQLVWVDAAATSRHRQRRPPRQARRPLPRNRPQPLLPSRPRRRPWPNFWKPRATR